MSGPTSGAYCQHWTTICCATFICVTDSVMPFWIDFLPNSLTFLQFCPYPSNLQVLACICGPTAWYLFNTPFVNLILKVILLHKSKIFFNTVVWLSVYIPFFYFRLGLELNKVYQWSHVMLGETNEGKSVECKKFFIRMICDRVQQRNSETVTINPFMEEISVRNRKCPDEEDKKNDPISGMGNPIKRTWCEDWRTSTWGIQE